MDGTVIVGLVLCFMGITMILFKGIWRPIAKGIGNFSAGSHNAVGRATGLYKYIRYKGFDGKEDPSNKGLNIVGVLLILFGIMFILSPADILS